MTLDREPGPAQGWWLYWASDGRYWGPYPSQRRVIEKGKWLLHHYLRRTGPFTPGVRG
jgi:hypothetical protein